MMIPANADTSSWAINSSNYYYSNGEAAIYNSSGIYAHATLMEDDFDLLSVDFPLDPNPDGI